MVYYILFVFLMILSILTQVRMSKELKLLIFILVNLILISFVGLRGDIEPDYENYLDIYNFSNSNPSSLGIELGYYWINNAFRTLGIPFQGVVFFMATVSIGLKTLFFNKYSPNFGLSLLIYFTSLFFLFDFIAIRQGIALSIFMVSIPFIYQRKFLPFLLLMLIAAQIHVTALLLIPGYFLFNIKFSQKALLALVLLCSVINVFRITVPLVEMALTVVSVPGVSADKVAVYLAEKEYAFVSVKQILLGFIFIFLKFRYKPKDEMINLLVNLFVFGILLGTVLNGLPQLAYRMKWYFFWTESVLLVHVIDYLSKGSLKTTYLLYVVIFGVYGYSLYSLLAEVAGRGNYIFPYKIFLQ